MDRKSSENIENQTALFSVLADTTRLKLIRLLSQQRESNSLCVNALSYQLGVTQPAVSQHLKVLKSAGLIKGERRGYRIHYFINHEAIKEAQKLINQALPIEDKINDKTQAGKKER
jgi:ArsR family transcriptional regulator